MSLIDRDKKVIWHPYTQMKLYGDVIPIVRGKGAYLISETGDKYIDAVSSWWVTLHGHAHPHIVNALHEQASTLEQVIFAGFTHPKAVELAERLLKVLPDNQSRIFYSDNGSTAVEVAIKMALQYWKNIESTKNRIIAIEGAYHGDTFGAMSVSERSAFTKPFTEKLFEVDFIPFPERNKEQAALSHFEKLISQGNTAAFIFEPLVQGAAGMRMYDKQVLKKLLDLCKKHSVLSIADEVMTGFGRTGKMFAMEYVQEKPDIVCLSKGITAGFMPFGTTTCTSEIYNAFYSDDVMKTFFHGHSYTGNPLACAIACASLDVFETEKTLEKITQIESSHQLFRKEISNYPCVKNIRILGTILAFEIDSSKTGYFNEIGKQAYNYFIENNVLLRPLGNVIYILPPYCITQEELNEVYQVITSFLQKISSVE